MLGIWNHKLYNWLHLPAMQTQTKSSGTLQAQPRSTLWYLTSTATQYSTFFVNSQDKQHKNNAINAKRFNLIQNGTVIPVKGWTGPEGSGGLRLPDFKTVSIWMWQGCQSYTPAAFNTRKYSRYSFLLGTDLNPGPQWGLKDYVNEKFQWHHWESNPQHPSL